MLASRAVHRESTQCWHWHWEMLLLVANKHRGLQDRQRPCTQSEVCSAHFWEPGLRHLEGGWGRSLQGGTTNQYLSWGPAKIAPQLLWDTSRTQPAILGIPLLITPATSLFTQYPSV